MDSRQAIVPVALRVNANLFQTDLCPDPVAMEGIRNASISDAGRGLQTPSCFRNYGRVVTTPSWGSALPEITVKIIFYTLPKQADHFLKEKTNGAS
jgi:hypothetical protein